MSDAAAGNPGHLSVARAPQQARGRGRAATRGACDGDRLAVEPQDAAAVAQRVQRYWERPRYVTGAPLGLVADVDERHRTGAQLGAEERDVPGIARLGAPGG